MKITECNRCGARIHRSHGYGYVALSIHDEFTGDLLENPYEHNDYCPKCMMDIEDCIETPTHRNSEKTQAKLPYTFTFRPADESGMMFASNEEVHKDKALFIHNFANLLRQTREQVMDLALSDDGNEITIEFEGGGTRKVNIALDSYTAIMKDVLKAL